eukprot:scpid47591/ scgid22337/ Uncharacterized protein ywoF
MTPLTVRIMALALFLGCLVFSLARAQEISDLECEVKKAALAYGARRITKNVAALERGLNFASNCSHSLPAAGAHASSDPSPRTPEDALALFVSPTGDDANPGTAEKPFRTLAQARDAIRFHKRQLTNASQWAGATVNLAAGKYHMAHPLHLSSEDSGTESGPITYQGADNGEVILSGGEALTLDWQKAASFGDNVYMAKVPEGSHFTSLFVNGVRQIRARFPNGDPQHMSGLCYSRTQEADEGCPGYAQATGGLQSDGHLEQQFEAEADREELRRAEWRAKRAASSDPEDLASQVQIHVASPMRPHRITGDDHFQSFQYLTDNGLTGMPGFGPVFSFWNNPYTSRPKGAKYDPAVFNKTWKNPETGVVHMFHSGLWGNWMFQIGSRDTAKNELNFAYGGWQEARGSGVRSNHFYVENIAEELDSPGEWFLDAAASTLYFYPNVTSCPDLSKAEVVAPRHATIVRMEGTVAHPVSHVTFRNLVLTETRTTFMDYYEVPSGGDWSIHRGAAFFMQGVTMATVTNCTFSAVGGNAVFLSEYVRNCTVSHNEIAWSGDSGIALVGRTAMIDGMQPTYPAGNLIANNHIHDFGMYGKQVSCYFQAMACGNTLRDNVCYNGPRAGINFNDGFGGNALLTGNLVFNMVRETGDHGPFNSWDRQPYVAPATCTSGDPSIVPAAPNRIDRNFIVNGYNGVWALDHDDGSAYFNDTNNLLVFGGLKNYLGHDKMSGPGNVVVYPGISSRSSGNRRCQTDDNGEFAFQYYYGNRCYTPDGKFYTFSRCDPAHLDDHVYQTRSNSHFSPGAAFSQDCGSKTYDFKAWQAAGQDINSTVQELPSAAEIV